MNQFNFAKQMLDFSRTSFENSYGAMCMMQEQSEKMMNSFMQQATWIPSEGKKAMADMTAMCKKSCSEFKKAMDENFVKAEALWKTGDQTTQA